MNALGLGAGLLSALVFGLAAVAQAHGVRQYDDAPDTLRSFVLAAVRDGWTLVVVVAYLVGFVLHAVAILLLPLYLAQATIAMSLPVTAVASRRVEAALTPARWAAVGVVTAGLVLLSLGAGKPGDVQTTGLFAGVTWLTIVALGVAALAARGAHGAVLGTLAGLGYAGSAVAVRGVTTPVDLVVVVSALAVPAYSIFAFWLYSLGMRRSAVSSATGPMIVGQTFVPAAVGVLLLGDGVRDGWWPAVVGGLALAIAGAVALGREVRSPDAAVTAS